MISFLLACSGDESSTTEPCCVIGEGPWSVQSGSDSSVPAAEAPVDALLWAHDPDADTSTHVWKEYVEDLTTNWHWLDEDHVWRVTVRGGAYSALTCGEDSGDPCEVMTATNPPRDPSGNLLEDAPAHSTPATYHLPGRYEVTVTNPYDSVGKKAYFYTQPLADGKRHEVFCRSTGFIGPSEYAQSVWVMKWKDDALPPEDKNGCPSDANAKFQAYDLELG